MVDTPPPAPDLLTQLSNRLNDMEVKLEKAEKENKKSYVDHPAMDARIVEIKGQMSSLETTIKELKAAGTPAPESKKVETPNDTRGEIERSLDILDPRI